jgi:hypothetical protein
MLYLSDSQYEHTPEDFRRFIRSHPQRLHLLMHPFWWVEGAEVPLDSITADWKYVIRCCENDFLQNRYYAESFPAGMGPELPAQFVRRLARSGISTANRAENRSKESEN